VAERFADRLGASLVPGFDRMLDPGDAAFGADRVAGFMETHDRREWVLPLSARRGMSWATAPVPESPLERVAFLLSVGFGNGSPLPQPSGHWTVSVNGHRAVDIRVVNHAQVWDEGRSVLAFAASRIETAPPYQGLTLSSTLSDEAFAAFGPAVLVVPAEWLEPGRAAAVRVEPAGPYPSTRWFQLATAPMIAIGSDLWRAADLLRQPRGRPLGEHRVYFGDLHTHSGQTREGCHDRGCGMGSREDNYGFARRAGGLDLYALTDHEWQVDPDRVGEYFDLADRHEEPGRFVCLPAYEHTSLLYGHRNIYFGDRVGPLVNTNRTNGELTFDPELVVSPAELWDRLETAGAPFLSVPHHPSAASHPFAIEHLHPVHDRLLEVYSSWGSSEYLGDFPRGVSDRHRGLDVQAAIRRGHRAGLLASSDGHDGHPGDAQSPLVKHHHIFHFCGSGRAAVLAPELTRSAVFAALMARRCYATTGPPILLDVRLDGVPMGGVARRAASGRPPVLTVQCEGANGLAEIRILRNGHVAHTEPCHGTWSHRLEWADQAGRSEAGDSYYVRVVQVDRESAWSSPIWVE
jgi:hypothetical protein